MEVESLNTPSTKGGGTPESRFSLPERLHHLQLVSLTRETIVRVRWEIYTGRLLYACHFAPVASLRVLE